MSAYWVGVYNCLRRALSGFKLFFKAALENFKVAFWHREALILLVYLPVAVFLIRSLGYRHFDDRTLTSLYYLLSAQVQVLSTIFALVFTITFVVAELASRYSQRILHQVLGPWALYYLVPYLIGIGLPLFLFNIDFPLLAAQISLMIKSLKIKIDFSLLEAQIPLLAMQISLMIGGFCLVLLIPYYITLRNRLSLNTAIQEMEHKIDHSLQDFGTFKQAFFDLQNFAIGAYGSYDLETFERALEALQRVCKKVIHRLREQSDSTQEEEVQEKETPDKLVCSNLVYMARWTLHHPRAPFVVIDTLRELGKEAVSLCQMSLARRFIMALLKIGSEALHQNIPDLASYAVGAIGFVTALAWEVVSGEEGTWIVKELTEIGQKAAQKPMDEVVGRVSLVLRIVATAAINAAIDTTDRGTKRRAQAVVERCSKAMGEVGSEAVKNNVSDSVVLDIVSRLGHTESRGGPTNIGVKAIQANFDSAARQVIQNLKQIYNEALNKNRHKVACSVIIAFGKLITELCRKEAVSMGDWKKRCMEMLVNHLCEAAQYAAKHMDALTTDQQDGQQEVVKFIEEVARNLGYAGQNALTIGDFESAEKCLNGLRILMDNLQQQGQLSAENWKRERVGWFLATSLGYICSHAAAKGLEEITLNACELLISIGNAAKQAEGWPTNSAVVIAIGNITKALSQPGETFPQSPSEIDPSQ